MANYSDCLALPNLAVAPPARTYCTPCMCVYFNRFPRSFHKSSGMRSEAERTWSVLLVRSGNLVQGAPRADASRRPTPPAAHRRPPRLSYDPIWYGPARLSRKKETPRVSRGRFGSGRKVDARIPNTE